MTVNTRAVILAFVADTDIAESYCPHCDTTKPISHFGIRTINGKRIPQSWCRKCRRDDAAEKREAARYARDHAPGLAGE